MTSGPAFLKRHKWIVTVLASAAIAAGATSLGLAEDLDHASENLRFASLRHDASGKIVVVEMDAASVAAIDRWPWPRENYARALQTLQRHRAAAVVFDVDFSSRSTPASDAVLANALRKADGLVVLPTFGQQATAGDHRSIDTMPLDIFRPSVALASVSIAPDADGIVRSAPYGTITENTPRPSLAAYIASQPGTAGQSFPIDYSILPGSIPRLSFVAVRDGKVDPAKIRGKTVLIGATAIEMGDRYATPSSGVLPGVIVQALAAETLLAGAPTTGSPGWSVALGLILSAGIATRRSAAQIFVASAIGLAILCSLMLFMQRGIHLILPLAPAVLAMTSSAALTAASLSFARSRKQRFADEDTGLPNKRALMGKSGSLAGAHIIVADLANLESITAVMGRATAGELIRRTADRLKLVAMDEAVYKVGDRLVSFALPPAAQLDELRGGLRAILQQPIELAGRKIDLAVSLGSAQIDEAGLDAAVSRATMAAEKASSNGWFWSEANADLAELDRSISLMAELDDAMAREEICYFYQPKYSLAENRIVSVEALARWHHPVHGQIRPDNFILLAERTGKIASLTLHLLGEALQDLALWRSCGHELSVAVNISAKLVCDVNFKADILKVLAMAHLPSGALIFEVTESATLDDPAAAAETLAAFCERGVTISMDDYGTGQSTLSYLRMLPLSELKIDKSFVEHAHHNRNDAVMVRSTINLAHDLGLKVVAEGVEDTACLDFLRSVGCDMVQGYLISRAVPCDRITDMLDDGFQLTLAA